VRHFGFVRSATSVHILEGDTALISKDLDQPSFVGVNHSSDGPKCFAKVSNIRDLAGLRATVKTDFIQPVDVVRVVAPRNSRDFGPLRSLAQLISREFVEDIS